MEMKTPFGQCPEEPKELVRNVKLYLKKYDRNSSRRDRPEGTRK
jgi:hypothetical protein